MIDRDTMMGRVRRGAALLDRVRPGWRARVRYDIDMHDCWSCVLGQVFGHYRDGLAGVGLWPEVRRADAAGYVTAVWPAVEHGFNLDLRDSAGPRSDQAWEALADCWRAVVAEPAAGA